MPPVTRIGDTCTGHDLCPPRPATSGEPSVTVSGSPVVRVGDAYAIHGCLVHPGHPGALATGAPHISVSGALLGRIGDAVSCGGAAAQGEPTVTAGNMGGSGVVVEQVHLFIHDGFGFEGDQELGRWTYTDSEKSFDYPLGTPLTNSDFRAFRERTGYGNDFRIMTLPELAWEGDFSYDVD